MNLTLLEILLLLLFCVNSMLQYNLMVYHLLIDYYGYIVTGLLIFMLLSQSLRYEKRVLLPSLLIVLLVMINTRINGLALGELLPIFIFIIIILMMLGIKKHENFDRCFLWINWISWGYLIAYAMIFKDSLETLANINSTVGIVDRSVLNPNTVGMGIAINYWLVRYAINDVKNKMIINIFMFACSILGLAISGSRTAMLSLISSMLFYCIFKNVMQRNKKFTTIIFMLIGVMGCIYPLVYIWAWLEYGGDMTFLGKPLFTGREIIWANLFNYMDDLPLSYAVGTGKVETLFWNDHFNLHNGYLSVGAEYGFSVLLLIFILIKKMIVRPYRLYKKKLPAKIIPLYMCLFVIMLEAYTETVFTYILSIIYPAIVLGLMNVIENNKDDL